MGGKLYNLPRMPSADYLLRERAVRRSLDRILGGHRTEKVAHSRSVPLCFHIVGCREV